MCNRFFAPVLMRHPAPFFLLLASLTFTSWCTAQERTSPALQKNKAIKIGFVTTLSTSAGAIGQGMRDASELALSHLGQTMAGVPVEILYEDDGFKPQIGKQKTDKLIHKEQVDFITGYIWSHVLLASYRSAVNNGTFLISANAGPSQIAGKLCHPNFFSASWQNDQVPMALGEVLNQRNIENLYVMSPNYAAGKNMVTGLMSTYKGNIVGKDMTKFPSQLDFSAELANVRAAKPDALFIFYPGKHGVQFFNQYVQSGLNKTIPLYSVFTVDSHLLERIGPQAHHSLMTLFWSPDLDNPTNRKFVADYKARYQRYPSHYDAQTYDAIMLINSAVSAVNGDLSDKDKVRAALKAAQFDSLRGDFYFGNNHFPVQNFYLGQVAQDPEGQFTTQILSTVYEKHQDSYAQHCRMQ